MQSIKFRLLDQFDQRDEVRKWCKDLGNEMNVSQLRIFAKNLKIANYSKLKKTDLCKAIAKHVSGIDSEIDKADHDKSLLHQFSPEGWLGQYKTLEDFLSVDHYWEDVLKDSKIYERVSTSEMLNSLKNVNFDKSDDRQYITLLYIVHVLGPSKWAEDSHKYLNLKKPL